MAFATAALAGYGGVISIGSNSGEVTNWNCNIKYDVLDATSMSSNGYKEIIMGLAGGDGTFDSLVKFGSLGDNTTNQLSLKTKTGGTEIKGNVFVKNIEHNDPVEEKLTFKYAFTFKGKITATGIIVA